MQAVGISRWLFWALVLLALVCAPSANAQAASDPGLGLIKLDVLVTDTSGTPIPGLRSTDFALLENGSPNRILSFQAFDGVSVKPEPPVEVILVIDTLQIPVGLASIERTSVVAFLRSNGGHLAQPVSIFTMLDTGLWQVAESSSDGNALAAQVAHNGEVALAYKFRGPANPPSLEALQALGAIATAERRKPGRKLLLWVGPGWGLGSGVYSEAAGPREDTFYAIYWFSTLLREARIALYSFSVGEDPSQLFTSLYKSYLNGVESVRDASFMDLTRKVLAVQSGGRVLDRSSDLVSQIESCVREAGAFYTLSFDPASADHPDEYHRLKVEISKPGLTARTNTGYYDQPFYSDQPNPGTRRATVAQLEELLNTLHGASDADVAKQLSALELTESLSALKLASWTAAFHGKKTQQALTFLADKSAFLPPPLAEIPAVAPPDATAQHRMITLLGDYLRDTLPKLPNYFAARTTVRYEEIAEFDAVHRKVLYEPLQMAESFKEAVLYRDGKEVADPGAAKRKKRKTSEPYLLTYGTFGPALGFVRDAIAAPGALTWSRWEQSPSGLRAVFSYRITVEKSLYQIAGCCLPDGDGTNGFAIRAGYHGEIAIDPASGAILRLQAQEDPKGFTVVSRSDILITYGPVEIGGKTFICPQRSVSIMRIRSLSLLMDWDEGFRTYGPYETMVNDISYGDYHMFRGESHMMPGFNPGG
jgi:VWFA-related protein